MAKFVISNVCGCVFSIVFQTVGDHFTWKIFCDHFVFWCICIDDECTFCREKFCKFAEGMTDIINIFEEIKMIRINIQNDPDGWEKAQEAVGIFACFCQEGFRLSNTDITADCRQDTAYTDGRVTFTFEKNVRKHGCGRGFAMCSGNCDGSIIVAHDLTKKLRSGQHRNAFFFCTCKFRVIRVNSCCIDNHLNRIGNIGGALTIVNFRTFAFQKTGQRAFFGIRTGNCKTFFKKNFSQSTHTDAADTNEMDGERFMKVYLIHNKNLLIFNAFYYTSVR